MMNIMYLINWNFNVKTFDAHTCTLSQTNMNLFSIVMLSVIFDKTLYKRVFNYWNYWSITCSSYGNELNVKCLIYQFWLLLSHFGMLLLKKNLSHVSTWFRGENLSLNLIPKHPFILYNSGCKRVCTTRL